MLNLGKIQDEVSKLVDAITLSNERQLELTSAIEDLYVVRTFPVQLRNTFREQIMMDYQTRLALLKAMALKYRELEKEVPLEISIEISAIEQVIERLVPEPVEPKKLKSVKVQTDGVKEDDEENYMEIFESLNTAFDV